MDVLIHLKKDTQQNLIWISNFKFYESLKNFKWNKKKHIFLKFSSSLLFFSLSYFKNYTYLPIVNVHVPL